jgi:hypothetical protein
MLRFAASGGHLILSIVLAGTTGHQDLPLGLGFGDEPIPILLQIGRP